MQLGFHKSSQRRKIRANIRTHGLTFEFIRHERNEFGEITDEIEKKIEIKGIYHIGSIMGGMYLTERERDGGVTPKKNAPMILVLYSDFIDEPIEQLDRVFVNGIENRVVEIINVAEVNFACDICLEVIN